MQCGGCTNIKFECFGGWVSSDSGSFEWKFMWTKKLYYKRVLCKNYLRLKFDWSWWILLFTGQEKKEPKYFRKENFKVRLIFWKGFIINMISDIQKFLDPSYTQYILFVDTFCEKYNHIKDLCFKSYTDHFLDRIKSKRLKSNT